jgi:O-antigen/teichoic acid export membrane protein
MTSDSRENSPSTSAKGIIGRFLHLLSAQVVEGIASALFFIYLARLDPTMFGGIMYALAAGGVVMKVVQYGLYYPLVGDLGSARRSQAPEILCRVNVIKITLLIGAMICIWGMALFRGLPIRMAWILFFVCLGFALDQVVDTFFADFRVRGRQDREARIKIAASILGYGFGTVAAFLGLSPILISLFKLVSAMTNMAFAIAFYLKDYSARIVIRPNWAAVVRVLKTASVFALIEILGVVYNKTNIFFLESAEGVKGVAFYSATWQLVDPISILASQQLLGWVIFPLLASLWWENRERMAELVRSAAQWLMALAFPIMFFLYLESELLIILIYGSEYTDSVWMQQYLVWTILLSFENNLFAYLMMVAGAAKVLLIFAVCALAANLALNVTLIGTYGLAGGCLVIVLTKLCMTVMTSTYCQIRFRLFSITDFLFPLVLAGGCLCLYLVLKPLITMHPAVAAVLITYFLLLWKQGNRFMGKLPKREKSSQ